MTVTLPAGYTIGKSFEHGLDVNLGSLAVPNWQEVRRISGFQPTDTPTTQDAQTYDDLGAINQDVTGWSWALAFNQQVHRSQTTGLYLPETEYLLARAGHPDAKGADAVAHVRWYHKPETGTPNPSEAFEGFGTVAKTRQNVGPNGEIDVYGFSLTGKGPKTPITNPFAGWDVTAPTVTGVLETAAGDGDLITIVGTGLLGATAITIDASPVTDFTVVNSSTIIAVMPVGDAGAVDIIVTTPGGVSAAFEYTRGA
jgi:hypothetical protein